MRTLMRGGLAPDHLLGGASHGILRAVDLNHQAGAAKLCPFRARPEDSGTMMLGSFAGWPVHWLNQPAIRMVAPAAAPASRRLRLRAAACSYVFTALRALHYFQF